MRKFALLIVFCISLFNVGLSWSNNAKIETDTYSANDFNDAVNGLSSKNFTQKMGYIQDIAASKDPQALFILQHLLDGKLYFLKKTKTIVIAETNQKKTKIHNAISGTDLVVTAKRSIKKVSINNQLRRQLKKEIARLSFSNVDDIVRTQAAEQILKNIDDVGLQLFTDRLAVEKNESIIEIIETGIALYLLKNGTTNEQLNAAELLSNSLYPEVKHTLSNNLEGITGSPLSAEKQELKRVLEASIKKIDYKLSWYKHLENIFFGVSLGYVLLLAAVGLAITFGVMGIINMAHC